jgi:hypothetical protein
MRDEDQMQFYSVVGGTAYTAWGVLNSGYDFTKGSWYMITWVIDRTEGANGVMRVYHNANLADTFDFESDISGVDFSNNGDGWIGGCQDFGTPSWFFNGTIDELSISNTARSSDWIAAQYLSMTDDFIDYGDEDSIWWDVDWKYRKKLRFDNGQQTESFDNFPVLVNLSSANFDYSKAKSDGTDLRFIDADGSTQLKYHIEEWNSSGYSLVWVNVTEIYGSSTIDYMRMYYGNSDASDVQDESGTYDSSYISVWHLNETSKTTGTYNDHHDSTSNDNDGEANMDEANMDTTGVIDGADEFDGTNDYIEIQDHSSLDLTGNFTIEVWAKKSDDNEAVIQKAIATDANNKGWWTRIITQGRYFAGIQDGSGSDFRWIGAGVIDNGEWNYLVATMDRTNISNIKMYRNGEENTTLMDNQATLDGIGDITNTYDVTIGDEYDSPTVAIFDGSMDEVRISNIVRSADWISAQYLSMADGFITYGNEEDILDTGCAYIFFGYSDISSNDINASNANVTIYGEDAGDLFGWSVSDLGNVNSDTKDDVIIGAPGAGAGKAYIFYGKSTWSTSYDASSADVEITGEVAGNHFGASVSGAGNVDNSDYNDVIVGAPYHGGSSWWNGDWTYRKKLTFNNTDQTEDLDEFPVLVRLNSTNFNYEKAKSDGSDLRFVDADDAAELKYHFEDWNYAGTSYIWVNVNRIDGSSSSDHINMYYGNPDAQDVQDVMGTYDTNFSGVWHMNEISGKLYDATSYSNDGTQFRGVTQDSSGQIDGADYFDGTSQEYISVSDSVSLDPPNNMTFEAWVKFDDLSSTIGYNQVFLYKIDTDSPYMDYELMLATDDYFYFGFYNSGGTDYWSWYAGSVSADTWYYIVGLRDGSNMRFYVNGDSTDCGGDSDASGTLNDGDGELRLGSEWDKYYINGSLDEVRLSNTARSADWIAAQYLSMTYSFITFGSEEEGKTGRAYMFYGDGSIPTSAASADKTYTGESAGDQFGFSVSGAGDVNNDGKDDVIIGAPYNDDSAEDAGEAYVFIGDLTGTSDLADSATITYGTVSAGSYTDTQAIGGNSHDIDEENINTVNPHTETVDNGDETISEGVNEAGSDYTDTQSDNNVYQEISEIYYGEDSTVYVATNVTTYGTIINFNNSKSASDSGANATLQEEYTGGRPLYLWICDATEDYIYKVDANASLSSGSEVGNYDLSWENTGTTYPNGMALYNDYVWCVDYGTDNIEQYYPNNGTLVATHDISGFSGDARGFTYGGGYFWIGDSGDDNIYKVDPSDYSMVDYIDCDLGYFSSDKPTYLEGLAWRDDIGSGRLIMTDPTEDKIYTIDIGNLSSNTIPNEDVTEVNTQASDPGGLGWDGEYFWITDDSGDTIYKVDPSNGNNVDSFSWTLGAPTGIDCQYILEDNNELDIEFNTTGVASADNYYLQLNYSTDGSENFGVEAYNHTSDGWDSLTGNLDQSTYTLKEYTLDSDHVSGSGYVRIKYKGLTETDDSTSSNLYIEYHRVRSYTVAKYSLQVTYTLDDFPTDRDNYQVRFYGATNRSSGGDSFTVQWRESDDNPTWNDLDTGTISGSSEIQLFENLGSTPNSNIEIRITDDTDAASTPNTTLKIDLVELYCWNNTEYDIDLYYTFDFGTVPTGNFDVTVYAYFNDAGAETLSIWAWDYDEGTPAFEDTSVNVNSGGSYGYTNVTDLGNEYVSATGEVKIRFKSDTVVGDGTNVGSLSIDYIQVINETESFGSQSVTLSGENSEDIFGWAVSNVSDINEDGSYDDVIVGAPSSVDNWWNTSWGCRQKLTFNNSAQSETMLNFPVMVNLSSSNIDYSRCKDDGTDLRFIDPDGSTEYTYHIENWYTSGYSYVWVNVTSITGGSATDYMWMYYNNSGASDVQDITGTYDHNYTGIWHLNETSGSAYDATSNDNDGTINGNPSRGYTGVMNYSIDFDGDGDYVDCGSDPEVEFHSGQNYTWSAWINRDANADWDQIFGVYTYDSAGLRVYVSTGGTPHVYVADHTNGNVRGSTTINLNTWTHVVMVYSTLTPTVPQVYVNGNKETMTGAAAYTTDTADSFCIGQGWSTEAFDGTIDEVKFSNMIRSDDWIAAQYKSEADTFITYGGEQENSEGKAHIFFGGDSMDTTTDVNLAGESAGDRFGYSVACAGDVDGDGKIDVIVGAPYWDNGGTTDCGQILVFRGGSSMDAIADYVHNGTQAYEHFGWSISLALKMDNGNYNMVVVGGPHYDGSTDIGEAEILYIPEYSTIITPFVGTIILFAIYRRKRKRKGGVKKGD